MRYYETLYIVNPNFEQDSLDAVMDTVGKEIERHSVTVINHRNWGKKRLAYLIQGNKFGTYILLQFETDEAGFLPEFDQFLKLQKTVIRSQTIRLDSRPDEFIEEEEPQTKPDKEDGDEKTADSTKTESDEEETKSGESEEKSDESESEVKDEDRDDEEAEESKETGDDASEAEDSDTEIDSEEDQKSSDAGEEESEPESKQE